MFGVAVAYDEVRYKYTVLQSLASNRFALGRVLHKAYDEIIYKYIIYNFYTVHSSLQPTARLLGKPCIKPTTKSKTFIFSSQ